MNDIMLHSEAVFGYGFIESEFLKEGEDEYRMRKPLSGKNESDFKPLKPIDIEMLIRYGNRCSDWSKILVTDTFDASLIRNSEFAGLVRIGKLQNLILEHHDMTIPCGITNSRIISCDIGDNCAVHSCHYLAHYQIGDCCILLNNDEIHVTNHAKWGNGVIKEGEPEDVRVWLDLMNEVGGRSVLPFDGMLCADAYLWAKRREDSALMDCFQNMTQELLDPRRGEYGSIGSGCVIKSNKIIKDVKIGECAYIKGANKIKNVTIKSSEVERTQIGEGVELVNGIVGYNCRIFYGCKAVRFVMGTNSALKYGARLIHSVLGDNSTVSCCEMLNNLIFPAHEQHHNTSFLIASLVGGQSNMAAGATVGSNHNSRSNDGEIFAGRGFWPALCTSLKHSSKFASYCLLSKGDYSYELNIPFPFALVSNDVARDRLVVMPAYWWMYNMYALQRNESKFKTRDKRISREQNIEFSPFAPDIAEEIFHSLKLLELFTGRAWYLSKSSDEKALGSGAESLYIKKGKELLLGPKEEVDGLEVLGEDIENSKRKVIIRKPRRAYKAYRHILRWYAMRVLIDYFAKRPDSSFAEAADIFSSERETEWDNLGGQIIPRGKVESIISQVKNGKIRTWDEMHQQYAKCWKEYEIDKAHHAWATLCALLDVKVLTEEALSKEVVRFMDTTHFIEDQVFITRHKDYDNKFKRATFSTEDEMKAVLGTPEKNSFVRQTKKDMENWRARSDALLSRLNN